MRKTGACSCVITVIPLCVGSQVTHVEPWEKGSRKTAGQTGMCGGVSEKYVHFKFPVSPLCISLLNLIRRSNSYDRIAQFVTP